MEKTVVQLAAKVRRILSWLIVRDLISPLVSLVGVLIATAVAFVGWRVAGQFQQMQRDLDAKSKLSAEIEKLADPQKRRFAVPALVQYSDQDPQMVVDSIMTLLDPPFSR